MNNGFRSLIATALDEERRRNGVPGASLAILCDGETYEATSGLLSLASNTAVTPDSLFEIGSVTKVITAAAAMTLVEEGRLDLDAPVRGHVPRLADISEDWALRISMRHLLSHTSGLADRVGLAGDDDSALERFVETLHDLPVLFPPGRHFSYSNVGYVVAGRVIEKLTGARWHDVVETRILRPLGCERTACLSHRRPPGRVAAGHLVDPDTGKLSVTTRRAPRCSAPAGSTMTMAAGDLLNVVAALFDGIGRNGARILGKDLCTRMQEPLVEVFDVKGTVAWGLGWELCDWNGTQIIGHDGSTIGQASYMFASPRDGFIYVLLTNGGSSTSLHLGLARTLLQEALGVDLPSIAEGADGADICPARYGNGAVSIDLGLNAGRPFVDSPGSGLGRQTLRPVGGDHYLVLMDDVPGTVSLLERDDDGRARYLRVLGRVYRRMD